MHEHVGFFVYSKPGILHPAAGILLAPNRNPPAVPHLRFATLRTYQGEASPCRMIPPRERAVAGTAAKPSPRTSLHPDAFVHFSRSRARGFEYRYSGFVRRYSGCGADHRAYRSRDRVHRLRRDVRRQQLALDRRLEGASVRAYQHCAEAPRSVRRTCPHPGATGN